MIRSGLTLGYFVSRFLIWILNIHVSIILFLPFLIITTERGEGDLFLADWRRKPCPLQTSPHW